MRKRSDEVPIIKSLYTNESNEYHTLEPASPERTDVYQSSILPFYIPRDIRTNLVLEGGAAKCKGAALGSVSLIVTVGLIRWQRLTSKLASVQH